MDLNGWRGVVGEIRDLGEVVGPLGVDKSVDCAHLPVANNLVLQVFPDDLCDELVFAVEFG